MTRNPFTNEVVEETSVAVRNNKFEDMGYDLAVDLTSAQAQFCSMKATTDTEKTKLFNAMNNPDKRLSDCINMTILTKDIYIEIVQCTNEETGEVTSCPRIVIIDVDGVSYQCVSIGIFSALKKAIQVFGSPTWKNGLPLEVKQISKGTKKMLTLNVNMK